jgi:hypothetical protein
MKRILTAVFIFFLFFATAPVRSANAAAAWKDFGGQEFGSALDENKSNLPSSVHTMSRSYGFEIGCGTIGLSCTGDQQKAYQYIQNSAAGVVGNVIASTFSNKPADFGLWLADTGQTLGFIPKQAYAQGIGFSGLTPILPIWKTFRNLAYLLMAVVMIVIGFMIMLRKKIDPKTVVTAQNAIPRVIIALILITFSYAIVGLMIDLMYVLIYFIAAVFKTTGFMDQPTALYTQGGLFENLSKVPINIYKILFGWNVDPMIASGVATVLSGILIAVSAATLSAGNPVGLLTSAGSILFIGMPLIQAVVGIMVFFLFLRLLAFFLSAYIQIIIGLLLGPLQLLAEALPGSTAFSSWFKNLVANMAVFPIGAAMFMLSGAFVHLSDVGQGSMWSPPYTLFLMANPSVNQVASLISLGILFAIPSVAGSVKEMLKAKPAVSMGGPNIMGGVSTGMQLLSAAYYIRMLRGEQKIPEVFGLKGGEEHQQKR